MDKPGCWLKKSGFTLLELMISAAIMVVVLTGLLAAYLAYFELSETTINSNKALNAAQEIMEQIRRGPDLNTMMGYNSLSYPIAGMPANSGLVHVSIDNSAGNILNVSVGACWMQKNSRIIGECENFGGNLAFSDLNGNQVLDSPLQLNSLMAQR
jgi:prepilin-type N-terminal cleavage/methylation domain-containing protein